MANAFAVWLRIHNISLSLTLSPTPSLPPSLSAVFHFHLSCSTLPASLNTKLIFLVWLAEICFAVQIKVTHFAIDNTHMHSRTHTAHTHAHKVYVTKQTLIYLYTLCALLCSALLDSALWPSGKVFQVMVNILLPSSCSSCVCVCVSGCVRAIFLLPSCNFALSSSFRTKLCIFVLEEANAPVHPFKFTHRHTDTY